MSTLRECADASVILDSVGGVQTSITNMLEFPYLRTRTSCTNKSKITTLPCVGSKKMRKRRGSDTSSDEERWLNAIETGKLEDVDDELKKIKNPRLMTARQRAMYERAQDPNSGFTEELIALPTGYKEKEKPQTAEEIHKAVLKSQKRKQQADERREKDKQKTMERLLKKQETHKQRYAVRIPPGYEFPLQPQIARTPPCAVLCCISGCGNPKAYNCSVTMDPLCSLACYKKNRKYSNQ